MKQLPELLVSGPSHLRTCVRKIPVIPSPSSEQLTDLKLPFPQHMEPVESISLVPVDYQNRFFHLTQVQVQE